MIRTMTRFRFLRHLFFLLLLLCGAVIEATNQIATYTRAGGRSLLHSSVTNTKFVVDLAGKVSLRHHSKETPIWSFSTGSPIYTSYEAPLISVVNNTENATEISRNFVVEYMDKDKSKAITVDNEYTLWTMDEMLKKIPLVTDDGVILGSKTATAYLVNGGTGELLHVYKSTDSSGDTKKTNALVKPTSTDNFVKFPLLITRTDSKLEHFDKATRKLVWNVTVSHFKADLLCDPVFDAGVNLGPEIFTGVYLPLQCGAQAEVHALVKSELFIRGPRDQSMKHRELQEQDGKSHTHVSRNIFGRSMVKLLVPLLVLGAALSVFIKRFSSRGGDLNSKSGPSKKKRNRKSGKDGITNGHKYELIEGGQMLVGFNNFQNDAADGRKIGKLFVSNKEIAKGSNGTVVFEGNYEGRPVAVKRLVRSHHEVAFKEIQNLIASDQHSNIIRWYGVEYDRDFVYLALERCTCSLDDLIKTYLEFSMTKVLGNIESNQAVPAYNIHLDSLSEVIQGNSLWKVGGHPSPLMLKLMRDIVSGLAHLHELGIVHRDLKPQNVLIIKGMTLSARLSDMGISKRLSGDMSSLGPLATGCGSSGWQAPEQLLRGRQTRAVDLFSLGCVLFYSITGCKHPFGDDLERDVNIVMNKVDLYLVEHVPEASDLISRLLNTNPDLRPSATEVLLHPMFWDSEMRLSFLRDASDRVELENREVDSDILEAMENTAPVAIGGKWDEKLEPIFITNIGRYRRYKYDSIRDLLRVIRNKLNHHRELPPEIQELVGTVPEGYDEYFAVRFPKLLIEVYKVISLHCKEEEVFRKYFKSNLI